MSEKRHILVVGGSRGIGRAFANLCLQRCWVVTVLSRSGEAPENSLGVQADLGDAGQFEAALRLAVERNGPLHSSAFFQRYRGKTDTWKGHWETSVVHLDAAVAALLPHFATTGDKSIVLVSSTAALLVAPEQDAAYHASRAAQLGLMRYLAVNLGSRGIRVNCISPGTLVKEENLTFFSGESEKRALCERASPLGRMGHAMEAASAAEFLCSANASWITGQNLVCDGGASLVSPESESRK